MLKQFSDLVGQTVSEVRTDGSGLFTFVLTDGSRAILYHDQDCCESVTLEDVCGDLDDLVGSPILLAEEVFSHENVPEQWCDSRTWTFYKLATVKGAVTLRFLGESNGYYSESVDFRWEAP